MELDSSLYRVDSGNSPINKDAFSHNKEFTPRFIRAGATPLNNTTSGHEKLRIKLSQFDDANRFAVVVFNSKTYEKKPERNMLSQWVPLNIGTKEHPQYVKAEIASLAARFAIFGLTKSEIIEKAARSGQLDDYIAEKISNFNDEALAINSFITDVDKNTPRFHKPGKMSPKQSDNILEALNKTKTYFSTDEHKDNSIIKNVFKKTIVETQEIYTFKMGGKTDLDKSDLDITLDNFAMNQYLSEDFSEDFPDASTLPGKIDTLTSELPWRVPNHRQPKALPRESMDGELDFWKNQQSSFGTRLVVEINKRGQKSVNLRYFLKKRILTKLRLCTQTVMFIN